VSLYDSHWTALTLSVFAMLIFWMHKRPIRVPPDGSKPRPRPMSEQP
jgi:hypothetical protein